ncbi:ABC transporter ATP-binding protein [Candidatus Fermentibacteria bacterium]|nr:ABC transporter ATP-binding protein [Candidatus Fermentibacteria bacterium]
MALLELAGLTKRFGALVAVDELNVSIERGEIRGLIGPNGSGKTTVFNLATGFYRPSAGRVLWQGEDVTLLSPERRAKLGIIRTFQQAALFGEMTVVNNVIVACHLHLDVGLAGQFLKTPKMRAVQRRIEARADEILELMGLLEVKHEVAGDLPHGSQRVLGIAMALASQPQLLLLDEPAAGMNPVETERLMSIIRMLRDKGTTMFLVEHDMKAVMSTCDRITVMDFGQGIAEGTPHEVAKNAAVIEAYLGGG